MKILIIGLGSIGKRHARLLQKNFQHELFALRSGAQGENNELGIPEIHSWEEVERLKPEVAFITNPTHLHVEVALKCAKLGMHLFMEKPLSHTMEGVEELARLCREKKITCYTAYCLRFHPVIQELKRLLQDKKIYHARATCSSYLPNWRPGTNHLQGYSASAKMGGGVVLDLSHEFDYCAYLFGAITTITGACGRVSNVTVDAEDVADAVLTTVSGTMANVHLNFMSLVSERKVIVDFEGGYAIGDLIASTVECLVEGKKETRTFSTDRDAYFTEQLHYFFDNLGDSAIMNNLEESVALLKKILEFKNK